MAEKVCPVWIGHLLASPLRRLVQNPKNILVVFFLCYTNTNGLSFYLTIKITLINRFTLILNFVMFPTFLLSGALFPVQNLPSWLVPVCYANPLTYGVDGFRGALLGADASRLSILLDFVLITAFSIGMVGIGSYLFESTEVER